MPRAIEARPGSTFLAGAAFALTGGGVALAGQGAQLAFAAAAIGTVGMLHGASDLAIVPGRRRAPFLAAYLSIAAAVLAAWRISPVAALAGFLILSAAHFATEDAPADAAAEQGARGLLLAFAPALLHRSALAGLFADLTNDPAAGAAIASGAGWVAALGVLLLPFALVSTYRRSTAAAAALLAVGAGAAVLLPPLVGFTLAFVLLHAWPQLTERMATTGVSRLPAYLRRHRLVLAGATGVVAAAAWLFADHAAPALSTLFAGLAALATPHMLVTPLFEPRPARAARNRFAPG